MVIKKGISHIKTTKISKPTKSNTISKTEFEQTLLDNFVNLQKVLTNIAVKFDSLSDQISKLLQLFEISAKSFAEKHSGEIPDIPKTDEKTLQKLDSLLDQNKTIAKGIMLMEERIRQKNPAPLIKEQESRLTNLFKSKPLPRI